MRKAALLALMVLPSLLIPAPAARAADTPAAIQRLIQAAENRMNAAAARKDADTILKMHTADYTAAIGPGQMLNRQEFERSLREAFASARKITGTTVITHITLKARLATVITRNRGEIVAVNPKTRKDLVLRVTNTDQEVWVKQGNVWRKRSSKTLRYTQTLNGRKISIPRR